MNTPSSPARSTRLFGAGILAVTLFASLTACSAEEAGEAAAPESTAAVSPSADTEEREPLRAMLVGIIDGDTIEVQPVNPQDGKPNGEPSMTVRMLGADAPSGEACGSAESAAHLDVLLRANEQLSITYEPELEESVDEDGHTLAYVITGGGVTQNIGLRMVREGFAAAAYPEGNPVPEAFEKFRSAGENAVSQGIGIWTSCEAP
ncbi:thermonuclease family protein [Arthrobacter koreensis]|uniref:thermonuclease family protein n=1 Tax=Arthrobacter koreensis TaxID=199136 RepID=UPI00380B21ED